jgi:hypothetical protein
MAGDGSLKMVICLSPLPVKHGQSHDLQVNMRAEKRPKGKILREKIKLTLKPLFTSCHMEALPEAGTDSINYGMNSISFKDDKQGIGAVVLGALMVVVTHSKTTMPLSRMRSTTSARLGESVDFCTVPMMTYSLRLVI